MSQAGIISTSAGPVPPSVATSYVTNNGTAVPAANILIIHADDSAENNTNGIVAKGGIPETAAANEVDIIITNRIVGTATTTDNTTPQSVYSFPLGTTPGTYLLEVRVIGFNATDSLSAGYTSTRTIRTDGATATQISATPGIISEETTMTGVNVVNSVSGNSATLTITGLTGKTIRWRALTTYIFVS